MYPPEETNFKFHRIEPSPSLPNPEAARAVLETLAADPAIRHVMRRYQLQVGMLTELAPQENPTLLGLNVNAGQIIKLRLRMDTCDGMRPYREIRRVLCRKSRLRRPLTMINSNFSYRWAHSQYVPGP